MLKLIKKFHNKLSKKKLYFKVFFFGFILDFMYVMWLKAVNADNIFLAGLASVLVALPGLLGYLEITLNRKMMFPYLLGLFFGTVASVTFF